MSTTTPTAETVDQLVSLVYVSAGVRLFGEPEVADILAQSHRNNERAGITGMLLYRDGNFMQVLEGSDAAVQTTLKRIRGDERHRGIVVLKTDKISQRSFSQWTMAFRKIGTEDLRGIEGYSPFMELSFDSKAFQERPDFGYRMLLQFKKKMR